GRKRLCFGNSSIYNAAVGDTVALKIDKDIGNELVDPDNKDAPGREVRAEFFGEDLHGSLAVADRASGDAGAAPNLLPAGERRLEEAVQALVQPGHADCRDHWR